MRAFGIHPRHGLTMALMLFIRTCAKAGIRNIVAESTGTMLSIDSSTAVLTDTPATI